jgi:proteasome lid subunit RPN8/RPN11
MALGWEVAGPREGPIRLYLQADVQAKMLLGSREGALRRREDMGILVGDWARDEDGRIYAVAWDLMTGPLEASPVSVRYTHEGLTEVAKGLEAQERDYVIVGWYHSHLDLGVFMSDRDLRTQRGAFPHAHQVAVVVDPMREVAGAFANGPTGPGTEPCRFVAYQEWEGSVFGRAPDGSGEEGEGL